MKINYSPCVAGQELPYRPSQLSPMHLGKADSKLGEKIGRVRREVVEERCWKMEVWREALAEDVSGFHRVDVVGKHDLAPDVKAASSVGCAANL